MKKFVIVKKFYSSNDKLFHVIKRDKSTFSSNDIDITYDSFDKFYIAVEKDLTNANLLEYDFENCNLKKYDFSKALISSNTMLKLGTYSNSLFKSINNDKQSFEFIPSKSLDLVPVRQMITEEDFENEDNIAFCYISDLHINHKILKKFEFNVNENEIKEYFRKIIQSLKESLPNLHYKSKIIFIGDISFNFKLFKLFFKIYREEIYQQTFFIIGNHELWDKTLNKNYKTIEEIIEQYRIYLSNLENSIILLENELYLPNTKKKIYSENDIKSMSKKDLRELFAKNGYAIFGGLGYSGLNDEFNYNQGIYRIAPINRQEEIERSKKVDYIHAKLREAVSDKKVLFVTHMPKNDWSIEEYVKDWIYLSGHTHKNYYCEDSTKNVYVDNQIGYYNTSFGFKYIVLSSNYDLFCDYNDGIYEISREQYKLFYYGIGTRIDFNRKFEKLYMLKRNNTYCFLIQIIPNSNFKLLNGGSIKNVGSHDLKYFYDNLSNYATSIKQFLFDYENFQKTISREIKNIGGSGNIHGSIVDIDFYNHLYINPLDATITPYFAYSITDKWVYQNLISLLKNKTPLLYNNYIKLIEQNNNDNKSLISIHRDLCENNKNIYVESTEMYRISRILKGLQFTTKYNIVRLWNDTIASSSSVESGRLIVSGIINPEEMKIINVKKKQQLKEERKKTNKTNVRIGLTEEQKKQNLFHKYDKKVQTKSDNLVKVISYTGAKEKAEFECLTCGYKWTRRADHFIERNQGKCPNCRLK